MKIAAALAVALISILPAAALGQPAGDSGWEPRLRGGLEFTYDDNILFLSKSRISLFESGSAPQRFRIVSVGDYVVSPWVSAAARAGDTEVGAGLQLSFYVRNSIKNYELVHPYIRHRFDRDNLLLVSYSWLRDGYAGEFTDPNSGSIQSVFYDVHSVTARFVHRFSRAAITTPRLGWRSRVYNHSQNDPRSYRGFEAGVASTLGPPEGLAFDLDLSFEDMAGPGRQSNYDVSFRRYSVEVGPVLRTPGRDVEFSLHYRYGIRRFTTANDPVADPGHAGRKDTSRQLHARAEYHFSRLLYGFGDYERQDFRTDIPALLLSEESASYSRNAFTLGLTRRY